MKRLRLPTATLWAVLLASVALVAGCSQPYASKVVSTSENQLTIADENATEQKTHDVAPDAQITLDDQSARLEDLDPGDAVDVKTVKTGDKEMATHIRARSKEAMEADQEAAEIPQDEWTQPPATPSEPRDHVPLPLSGAAPPSQPQPSTTNPEEGAPPEALHEEEGGHEQFGGIVSKVSLVDDEFTVGDEQGAEHTFLVDGHTTFTLDGQEATFGDLQTGHKAEVTAAKDGEMYLAKTVAASSR